MRAILQAGQRLVPDGLRRHEPQNGRRVGPEKIVGGNADGVRGKNGFPAAGRYAQADIGQARQRGGGVKGRFVKL
jgi:hypothetical protein